MNSNKWVHIAHTMSWLATGVAVLAAIYITKSAQPLWAMLIPCFISFADKKED